MIRIENVQQTGRAIDLRKVVIKLGSAVVAGDGQSVDMAALGSLAGAVAALRAQGVQVILVSSGAVGMGRRAFPEFKPRSIPDRQALAAIGQVGLMSAYKELFNQRGFRAAQVLLTRDDMEDRRRYLNARYTLERLLELGAVPVINENDTVTIEELQFGDNDQLSAVVATKMEADLLIILSVAEGLLGELQPEGRGGKKKKPAGEIIPAVLRLDESIHGLAAGVSGMGTGGMTTKLRAVEMATQAGVHAIIAGGKTPGIVEQILTGRFRGTYFAPRAMPRLSGRDRWLAYGRRAGGCRLTIDEGACHALIVGKKSLLAAGIREVEGTFARGDLVEVAGPDGCVIGRGLVNYSAQDLERIKGLKTAQIEKLLGELSYPEAIHRDNLVMTPLAG